MRTLEWWAGGDSATRCSIYLRPAQAREGAEGPGRLLRAPEFAHVDALFEIQGDKEAMRYTHAAPDRDATARFIEECGA